MTTLSGRKSSRPKQETHELEEYYWGKDVREKIQEFLKDLKEEWARDVECDFRKKIDKKAEEHFGKDLI